MRTIPRLLLLIVTLLLCSAGPQGQARKTFRVWVFADAHVGSDRKNGRDSLATAIQQSEAASGFAWDIALELGDMSGEQATPKDPEGAEVVRQFGALKRHRSSVTTVTILKERRRVPLTCTG